jgi:group I intron endonuclease
MNRLDEFGKLFIYLVRQDGRPVYVGQVYGSKQSVNRRWRQHCANPSHGRKLWHAIQAFGLEHFLVEIIDEAKDRNELNQMEQHWVRVLKTFPEGLNGNAGGISVIRTGQKHTEETKQVMREKATGREHTEETKKRISQVMIGDTRNLGKKRGPRPEEVVEKIREAMIGVEHTEERKENQAKAAKSRFSDPAKKAAWYAARWGKKKEQQVA